MSARNTHQAKQMRREERAVERRKPRPEPKPLLGVGRAVLRKEFFRPRAGK